MSDLHVNEINLEFHLRRMMPRGQGGNRFVITLSTTCSDKISIPILQRDNKYYWFTHFRRIELNLLFPFSLDNIPSHDSPLRSQGHFRVSS